MLTPTKCCSNPNCTAVNPQSAFEFSLNNCALDGLQSRCRTCEKLHYEAHREERRQYGKLHYEAHKEEKRQKNKLHYEAHREENLQRQKLYNEAHKEEKRKKYFDKRDTQDFINIMVAINIVNEKLANKRSEAC